MKKIPEALRTLAVRLEVRLLGHPKAVILLACIACGFSLYYTAQNLRVNLTPQYTVPRLTFSAGKASFFKDFPTG